MVPSAIPGVIDTIPPGITESSGGVAISGFVPSVGAVVSIPPTPGSVIAVAVVAAKVTL